MVEKLIPPWVMITTIILLNVDGITLPSESVFLNSYAIEAIRPQTSFFRQKMVINTGTHNWSKCKDWVSMESSVIHETPVSLPYPPKGEASLLKKKLDDCNKTKTKHCLRDEKWLDCCSCCGLPENNLHKVKLINIPSWGESVSWALLLTEKLQTLAGLTGRINFLYDMAIVRSIVPNLWSQTLEYMGRAVYSPICRNTWAEQIVLDRLLKTNKQKWRAEGGSRVVVTSLSCWFLILKFEPK